MKAKENFGWFKRTGQLLVTTFNSFMNDKALKMSASLAYYTVFSMAPLIIMLISLAGLIYGKDAIEGKVFEEINGFVGNDAALQIQQIISKISQSGDSLFAVIIGAVTLFLGATGVFIEIQDSLNQIWRVKAKPKKGWKKMIINRILSFSMILGLGFLLIVSLIINGVVLALSNKLNHYFPDITIVLVNAFNITLTFIIISVLFGIIFKFLPDVKIGWKDVRAGAIFTAILFMIGRFVIGLYIEKVGPGSAYGAAGSLIIILVWVYYTAAILYFGAEFTQVYAECYGGKIEPAEYAVHVVQTEREKSVKVLPSQKQEDLSKDH
jgi:membrane protein